MLRKNWLLEKNDSVLRQVKFLPRWEHSAAYSGISVEKELDGQMYLY